MKNRSTHFEVNDSYGKQAEEVVRGLLSQNCKVLPKSRCTDPDVTVDLGSYGLIGIGVERLRKWTRVGEFQYPHYNLLTHKRARKMLNREEVFLFVVSDCLEQFLFITPDVTLLDEDAYQPRGMIQTAGGGSFRRGSDDDPLTLMRCPWGYDERGGGEWAFKVSPGPVHRFDSVPPVPWSKVMKKISWTGPAPTDSSWRKP